MNNNLIFIFLLGLTLVIMMINNSSLKKEIKKLNKRIDDIPPPIPNMSISEDPFADKPVSNNRRGIIKQSYSETLSDKTKKDHDAIIEVEETEQLGNMSRIKIIKITGAPLNVIKYAEQNHPEIIESVKINFF